MPSVVQTAGTALSTTANTLSISFGSNVTAGNLIVVTLGFYGFNPGTVTLSDSLNTNYTIQTSYNDADNNFVYLATGKAPSGGADTVTASFTGTGCRANLLEASGVTTTGIVIATPGTGATNSAATASTSFTFTSYLAIGTYVAGTPVAGTNTAGSGFALFNSADDNGNRQGAEYSTTISSPTTFPMTIGGTVGHWAEVGVILNAATTAAFFESGSKREYRRGNAR